MTMPPDAFQFSKDACYQRMRRAVAADDPSTLAEALSASPREVWVVMALKAAAWSIEQGSVKCLREALSRQWAWDVVDLMPNKNHPTLLHLLVDQINVARRSQRKPIDKRRLLQALVDAGADLENESTTDKPLVLAVRYNDLEMVEALLDAGANPRPGHRTPSTTLACPPFCEATSLEMVDLLLKKEVPYTHAAPSEMLGGIGALLLKWRDENQLRRLVSLWLKHGGKMDEPLEAPYGPSMSLGDFVFDLASELNEPPRGPAQAELHESTRQRLFLIQEALVLAGLPLTTTTSSGKTWGELVMEKGSPRLQVQWSLENVDAATAPRSRPRM